MPPTEQKTIAIEAEQKARREKYAGCTCDDVDQSVKIDAVAVFLGKMRHEMEVLLSAMRCGKVPTPEMPDDVAEVVTDHVGEALKDVKPEYGYEYHGIGGNVAFVEKSTFGVKSRDVVAFIKDEAWGAEGLMHEEVFNQHDNEVENWNEAEAWMLLHVNSLVEARKWRDSQTT